jgi:transcriptional regulator with PAS, ATPase and Fis domain
MTKEESPSLQELIDLNLEWTNDRAEAEERAAREYLANLYSEPESSDIATDKPSFSTDREENKTVACIFPDTSKLNLEFLREYPDAEDVYQYGVCDDGGQPISERLNQSMMQRTKMFVLLSETCSDPHFIKDMSLRYVYVNKAMERMLKKPRNFVLGSTDRKLYGKADATELTNANNQALLGSSLRMKRARRISGKRRVFIDTLVPWKDDRGKITGIYGSHVDITDDEETYDFSEITDSEYPSRIMRDTLEQALLVSKTRSTVLLLGESGCGKDFLSRYIHDHSERANGPFRSVNCAALPHELVESELFGHERGAFSGANARKRGHVELAHHGTMVLNEIGELPLVLQSKLLSFLDNRTFTRVGGENEIQVDIRIIAATNRNLENEVRQGRFREDLLYRLNVFGIRVPSLRQRKEDLPLLVSKLLPELAEKMGRNPVPELESSAMQAILSYDWPGNVRELRNVLERALVRSTHGRISGSSLGLSTREGQEIRINYEEEDCESTTHSAGTDHPTTLAPSDNYETDDLNPKKIGKPTPLELDALYQEYIVELGWSRAQLAAYLTVDSSTLKKWMKNAGLPAGRAGRPRKNKE